MKEQFNISLDPEVISRFRKEAKARKISLAKFFIEVFSFYLGEKEEKDIDFREFREELISLRKKIDELSNLNR